MIPAGTRFDDQCRSIPSPTSFISVQRNQSGRIEHRGVPDWIYSCDLGVHGGIYARWHWNGRELTAETDHFGLGQIFYARIPDGVVLSPSLLTLFCQGVPTTLDREALAAFVRLGFFLEEDTPLAAVRILPPGGSLRWFEGQLELSTTRPRPARQHMLRKSAMEGFVHLFRAAINKRQACGRCVLPLTGGRDSRHIFLELAKQGDAPSKTVTMRRLPARPNDEATIAALLSKILDVPHEIIRSHVYRASQETAKNIKTNFSSLGSGSRIPLTSYLRTHSDTIYDGVAGDILLARKHLAANTCRHYENGNLIEVTQGLFTYFGLSEFTINRLCGTRFPLEMAVERMMRALRPHLDASDPLKEFFFWNRTRRAVGICSIELYADIPRVYMPFLDYDLFTLLFSLPPEVVDAHFHTDAIRIAYPQWSHIPYAGRVNITPLYLAKATPELLAALIDCLRFTIALGAPPPTKTISSFPADWRNFQKLLGMAHYLADLGRALSHDLMAQGS